MSEHRIANIFIDALQASSVSMDPFEHYIMRSSFPTDVCEEIVTLPIEPKPFGQTDGTRGSYNHLRTFVTPELRDKFPVLNRLATALNSLHVAFHLEETFGIEAQDAFLRIEYIQDTDGMWLEPHRDIPEKLFSMVVYLCKGKDAEFWGTDVYDRNKKWVGSSSAEFGSAVVFKAGPDTWHGFEKRSIKGVRRLMEINYVKGWKDTEQLAFPDRPISFIK